MELTVQAANDLKNNKTQVELFDCLGWCLLELIRTGYVQQCSVQRKYRG